MFGLLTASLLQAMRSAVIGAFRSSTVSLVRQGDCSLSGPLLYGSIALCFLIVGIHASGISIPLSLLMLLE